MTKTGWLLYFKCLKYVQYNAHILGGWFKDTVLIYKDALEVSY